MEQVPGLAAPSELSLCLLDSCEEDPDIGIVVEEQVFLSASSTL